MPNRPGAERPASARPAPSRPDTAARPRVAYALTQCWHRVPGGTATAALDLADALARTGRVDLVGVGSRGSVTDPAFRPSIPTASLRIPVPYLYDAWDRLRRPTLESASGPVDLVHLTLPMSPPRSTTPLVATVHDLFPMSHPEWFTGRGARLMRRGLRRIGAEAEAVLVPSEATARECEALGFADGRVHLVPLGCTPADVDDDAVAAARARHGLTGDYVLFVGTLEPRKGLAVLAEAMVRLGRPDVALAIAGPAGWGDGDPTGVGAVPGPVVRLGFLDAAELAALRRGAGACCAPSWAEGFGLPVLEALAAGAPVVTTAGTSQAEVAGDAAVLFEPGDADGLAAALARVLDDADLAATLRAAGPDRAAGYSWDATAAGVLGAYRSVLGASAGADAGRADDRPPRVVP